MFVRIKNSIECYITRELENNSREVLLLHKPETRRHPAFWQPVTGGIENSEIPREACLREIREETGLILDYSDVLDLHYNFQIKIDEDDLLIKKKLFMFHSTNKNFDIIISDEHNDYKWVKIEDVIKYLFWESNKNTFKKLVNSIVKDREKMSIYDESLVFHKELGGKLEVISRCKIEDAKDLSLAYTPGVAQPCLEINKDPQNAYIYTRKWNTVAVVSDGTAVLGLGDIGPLASLPVMEGKSILFKTFGDVDAFPIVVDTKNVDEIVETVARISGSFGGINLEDISAPRCFEVEKKLKERLDIPVFHDDQHGTAVVVLAGLINALKIVNKKLEDLKVVMNGAGAAGTAIAKLLISSGVKNIVMCDIDGVVYRGRKNMNSALEELANLTNSENVTGKLADVIAGADVFIGVSVPNVLSSDMVKTMSSDSIIFAMANPTPEIFPEDAKKSGARVVGTGRSDFPNQVNNVLAFPGIFRGALDVRAREINEEMKVAAAYSIAESISEDELNEDYIIPKSFNKEVQCKVAQAVREAARKSGVARL